MSVVQILLQQLPLLIELSDVLRTGWRNSSEASNCAAVFAYQMSTISTTFMSWMAAYPTLRQAAHQSEPRRIKTSAQPVLPSTCNPHRAFSEQQTGIRSPEQGLLPELHSDSSHTGHGGGSSGDDQRPVTLSRQASITYSSSSTYYVDSSEPPSPSPHSKTKAFKFRAPKASRTAKISAKEREVGERNLLDLQDYLSQPLHRLVRYASLIRLVSHCTSDTDSLK